MLSKANRQNLPRTLKGFSHINRYWDPKHQIYAAKILPGEYYVTRENETVITTLGSCVSACAWDPVNRIGGMNHFMLPVDKGSGSWNEMGASASARYGNFAMEKLINDILKNGGQRMHLRFKVTGGGKILQNMTNIGMMNIRFVREYIQNEGFKLESEDLGDIYPRKVMFFPQEGILRVKKLRSLHNDTIIRREKTYLDHLEEKPVEGEVELF